MPSRSAGGLEVPRARAQRREQLRLADLGGLAPRRRHRPGGEACGGRGGVRRSAIVPRSAAMPGSSTRQCGPASDDELPGDVAQLADVAGPGVAHQPRGERGRQPGLGVGVRRGQAVVLADGLQLLAGEVVEQQADVLAALAQRRQPDLVAGQPVQQRRLEAPVRGCCASRLASVAAMSRTSTGPGVVAPTGYISPVSSTRSSITCTSGGASPTSSRNSVPPWAARKKPSRSRVAPV